jgi:hypothetical protein
MAEEVYQRLTRNHARSVFGITSVDRCSLWLGSDHLLSVETSGFTERYKRFYFRDIQALVLRRTKVWEYTNLACGIAAGLLLLVAILTSTTPVRYVFLCLVTPVVIGLIGNLAFGPTCACQIRTAVQTENLPSLCRLRRTRAIIERLRPLIAGAQGELSPDRISSEMQAHLAAEIGLPPVPTSAPADTGNPGDPLTPAGPGPA